MKIANIIRLVILFVLLAPLAAFSLNEHGDLVISGINVYIQDGLGTTGCGPDAPVFNHDCNGKGNLIVGYDHDNGDLKTGDHNLVIGDAHTYTSYGGFVAGRNNEISNSWASVCGGYDNIAIGWASSVSGGGSNIAFSEQSTAGGGSFLSTDEGIIGDWVASSPGP